jgi:hypothetical protein
MEDRLALAHPEKPTLPRIADNGAEVSSFPVLPFAETGGILPVTAR